MNNLIPRDSLAKKAEELKAQGKKIVTTNGCFDILHLGHVRILEAAKQLGDILIVGINTDDSVKRLKGPERPINTDLERAEVIGALKSVDYVTIFSEDTPVEFLEQIKPDIHVKGSDYKPSDLAETPTVEKHGGHVHILGLVDGKSTTGILKKIRE